MYNPMTCQGWEDAGFLSGCGIAWGGMVILFYVVMVSRRQIDNMGFFDYNLIGGFAGSFVPYLIWIIIFGTMKWALLIGLIGSLVGGWLGGMILGGSEDAFG